MKSYCPRCGSLVVNGIHYSVGKNTPSWSDEELEIFSKIPFSEGVKTK